MRKKTWKKRIKDAAEAAGTYQPFFDSVIDTLAGVMEMRDDAERKFIVTGGNTVVTHTNKSGQTNIVKNPALVVVMECNAIALTYWKELGLTSRSYRMMTGGLAPQDEKTDLGGVLGALGL